MHGILGRCFFFLYIFLSYIGGTDEAICYAETASSPEDRKFANHLININGEEVLNKRKVYERSRANAWSNEDSILKLATAIMKESAELKKKFGIDAIEVSAMNALQPLNVNFIYPYQANTIMWQISYCTLLAKHIFFSKQMTFSGRFTTLQLFMAPYNVPKQCTGNFCVWKELVSQGRKNSLLGSTIMVVLKRSSMVTLTSCVFEVKVFNLLAI